MPSISYDFTGRSVIVTGAARGVVLPHPEVQRYYELRARDTGKWLRGMRRIQRQIAEIS